MNITEEDRLYMTKFNLYTKHIDMTFWREFCNRKGRVMHFNKGETLARRGGKAKYWGVVISGYFKYSLTDKEGNTHVTGLAFADDFVGDFLNVIEAGNVGTDIIAATAAEVMICDVSLIRHLLVENPDVCRAMAIALFRQAYTLYLEMHVKTPKERYMALLERCPGIQHNITLRDMASYLQITPTHLSRIRKEITFDG